jgi:hypothetical protein
MFAGIHQITYRDREAELYRAAARNRQVRLARQSERDQDSERDERRREAEPDEGPVRRRWNLRRTRNASVAGTC